MSGGKRLVANAKAAPRQIFMSSIVIIGSSLAIETALLSSEEREGQMTKPETVAIPFTTMGNRQVLTAVQLAEHPWLADFARRFENCFEPDHCADVLIFYSGGKP